MSGIVGIRIRDRSSSFYAVHNYSVAIQRLCFIYIQNPNGQRIRVRGEWLQIMADCCVESENTRHMISTNQMERGWNSGAAHASGDFRGKRL